ncbi:hypothetical protein BG015_006853 [Linnemannia schmuckeri]|uniref:Uncharacterized protein n=1 Tax=Linnemannia schmuckeri TaxID=64567 RepID=A0A9P5RZD0_9FUNG|nr:hypothetical protein BG015_006853 [Linnemannia schmuckeri]
MQDSVLMRPKATITLSTTSHHNHYDFRIRPFLFSHSSRTAATAALRHTKTGSICKSTPPRNIVPHCNISHLCVLPASMTVAAGTEKEEEGEDDDDDDDETEDVEIDIDGDGRSGYDCNNGNYTGSSPTTISVATTRPGNSATHLSYPHATTAASAAGQCQLFGHEEFEFGTGPVSALSASAAASVFGFGAGLESASSQQVPSLSSSVCSTSSTLSTPPIDLDYSFNTTYPQQRQQQKDELVKLKREAFQELASQTQRFDDLFIAKMIHWESLSSEEKAQWLERGHGHSDGTIMEAEVEPPQHFQHLSAQQYPQRHQWKPREQEQEMDDLVNALECRATVKDYSALIAFEQQAETQRHSLMEQY